MQRQELTQEEANERFPRGTQLLFAYRFQPDLLRSATVVDPPGTDPGVPVVVIYVDMRSPFGTQALFPNQDLIRVVGRPEGLSCGAMS